MRDFSRSPEPEGSDKESDDKIFVVHEHNASHLHYAANFEGTIPEGMYGAGTVRIWDKGEFSIEEEKDGRLLFELKGKKLSGRYALIKTKFKGKESWLFFKRK